MLASLCFRGSVRTSQRYHLLLPPELKAELTRYASEHGCSIAAALRSVAAVGLLANHVSAPVSLVDSPASLAALVAAEQAVLMVASVLPDGELRMAELATRATQAAEERLTLFREAR